MKVIKLMRNKREDELSFSQHGIKQPTKTNYYLLDYFDECLAKKFNYKLECLNIHLHKYFNHKKVVHNDVDEDLLNNFQNYLIKQVSRNTTKAYMTIFRQHFNKLVVKGIIQSSPFGSFKIIEEEESVYQLFYAGHVCLECKCK